MARKQKEKKIKERRGKAGAVLTGFFVVLAAVSVVLACTVFFRVEHVEVEGASHYSPEEIIGAANVAVGANLVLTPGEQMESRVLKSLTYVDAVEVQKRFPTTLALVVTEAQPTAVISGANLMQPNEEQLREGMTPTVEPTGELWIIDSKGKLLEQTDEEGAAQYIRVTGLLAMNPVLGQQIQVQSGDQGRLAALTGLMQALENKGLIDQITAIDATLGTEIAMVYDGRVTVKMLSNTDYARKIRIFEEVSVLLREYDQGILNMKSDKVFFSPTP